MARLKTEDRETVYLNLARWQIASGEEKTTLAKLIESKYPDVNLKDIPELPPEKLQAVARKFLEDLLTHESFGPAFRNNMNVFEQRMRSKPGEQEEIGKTYLQLARLLTAGDSAPCDQDERSLLARHIISNAARPYNIDQGDHRTCNAAAVEVRTYCLYPGQAARVVADIGCTNKYTTASKTVVSLDYLSMRKDTESTDYGFFPAQRNYASQIFQVTAVNAFWRTQPGDISYRQQRAQPGDTGERLWDGEKKEEIGRGPQLTVNSITDMSYEITGRHETTVLYCKSEEATFETQTDAFPVDIKRLRGVLKQAKDGNPSIKLPLIVSVYTQNKPFSEYSTPGKNGAGGGHVVNIMDYDPDTEEVTVDNTWGRAKDHTGNRGEKPKMKLADLEAAMHQPAKKE